jgi:hypothetical protein
MKILSSIDNANNNSITFKDAIIKSNLLKFFDRYILIPYPTILSKISIQNIIVRQTSIIPII